MPNFNGLRGFVSFYAAVSLFLYTWNYLESFYSGDNIEKKIAVKEGLLYLSFAFLLFGTSARRPTFMIPYLAIHLFTIVRSFFEMFHNLYLTFSDEDGYGLRCGSSDTFTNLELWIYEFFSRIFIMISFSTDKLRKKRPVLNQ